MALPAAAVARRQSIPTLPDVAASKHSMLPISTRNLAMNECHGALRSAIAALGACFLFAGFYLGAPMLAQAADPQPLGVAWSVRGAWQIAGRKTPIVAGDGIQPGSLLRPQEETGSHSITVLLPDGQRILDECFTPEDCARGFRVPLLSRAPDPFAVAMLASVRAFIGVEKLEAASTTYAREAQRLPRDEAVARLQSGNRVAIAGLAARLPNGRYSCRLLRLDDAQARATQLQIEKDAPSVEFALPSPGLYDLRFTDNLNRPRIDLFLAAVSPERAPAVQDSFSKAASLLKRWNLSYYAWPVHEFQRAYLQALVLGVKPYSRAIQNDSDGGIRLASAALHTAGVAAEPKFSPQPGSLGGDAAVSLYCDTPGAHIHYTVDGSQPMNSSPVYEAPIEVKGSGLTIKAFAGVTGDKDSPVVTGIFRILHQ
jgi:hypothetical protein